MFAGNLPSVLELLTSTEDKSQMMDELVLQVERQIINTLTKQQWNEGNGTGNSLSTSLTRTGNPKEAHSKSRECKRPEAGVWKDWQSEGTAEGDSR